VKRRKNPATGAVLGGAAIGAVVLGGISLAVYKVRRAQLEANFEKCKAEPVDPNKGKVCLGPAFLDQPFPQFFWPYWGTVAGTVLGAGLGAGVGALVSK
jgi:hypothetical protein